MIDAYRKLATLLDEQNQALAAGDARRRDATQIHIDRVGTEVREMEIRPETLDCEAREALRDLLHQVTEAARENERLWKEHLAGLQGEGSQLRSTRRYVAARQPQEMAGRRFQRMG